MVKVKSFWVLILGLIMLVVLMGFFDPLFNRSVKAANWTDNGLYAESFAGGSGTESSPYLISNAKELARMGVITSVHTGKLCFKLIRSVDLSGNNWKIINNAGMYHENLSASIDFNGNAHTIENLNSVNGDNGGIFKYFNGKFYNAFIKNAYVNNAASGTITSHLVGTIENVQVTGRVISKNNQAGGIVAFNAASSMISNCSFIGNVEFNPNSVALQDKIEIQRRTVYNFTRGLDYGLSPIYGTMIHGYQKVFFEDTKRITRSLSDKFWVGGIAGIGAGTIKDCYFVGDIIGSKTYNSKSYTYNYDDRNGLPYTEEFVNKNVSIGNAKPVNNITQSRWGRHWVNFGTRTVGAANVTQAVSRYFGYAVNENSSDQATLFESPWYAEVEYNRLSNGTFEGHKQSYTVTTTSEAYSTAYPSAIAGQGNIVNCFFQSGNNNLYLIGESNKANDMTKQSISSNWALDSAINNGYPYLKALYWQESYN